MKLNATFMTLLILLICPVAVQAEIYKWTDAYGHVHFSNKPVAEVKAAKRVELGAENAVSNPNFNLKRMQVPYVSNHGNMIVKGQVNGVPMRFVVDTGASFVSIPASIAKKAGIQIQGAKKVTLQTANGLMQAPRVTINKLAIGHLMRQGIACTVQSISETQEIGLLGMSFLSHYRMTIDQQGGVLLLEPR
ncbi:MAG: TIGR02281 family clan AA aspartic protease [Mariprofundaceae bacterium]